MSDINKSDIDQFIADELNLSVKDVDAITDMFLRQIIDQMGQGFNVDLHRFGTFEVKERKARKGRNPQTGEVIEIAAKNYAKFKPWKAMRDAVV